MARGAPNTSEEKENVELPTLRKKPVRRATAKASATTTKSKKKVEDEEPKPQPLSPKKITQVARTRRAAQSVETEKPKPVLEPPQSQPKRSTRKAAAAAPKRAPGRPRRTRGTAKVQEDQDQEEESEPVQEEPLPTDNEAVAAHEEHAPEESSVAEDEATVDTMEEETPEEPIDETQVTPRVSNRKDKTPVRAVTAQPMQPTPQQQQHVESAIEEDAESSSDDELCGPKTPMRRNTNTKPVQSMRKLETPAQRFRVLGTSQGTPQTLKVPTKAPAPESVQRPMTVARGMSASHVFRPLSKRLSPMRSQTPRAETPSARDAAPNEEESVDESDEAEDNEETEADGTELDEEHDEQEISFINRQPSPPKKAEEPAFGDLDIAEEEEQQQEEEDSEDEELDEPSDVDVDATVNIDPSYASIETPEESEDEIGDLSDAAFENPYAPKTVDGPADIHDIEEVEDDTEELEHEGQSTEDEEEQEQEDEDDVEEPQLDSELFASSPEQDAPQVSSDELEASSPAPQTPAAAFQQPLDETPDDVEQTPVARLSLPYRPSRLSLPSATAKLLQTPHMQSFAMPIPDEDADELIDASDLTACIDPSFLSMQEMQGGNNGAQRMYVHDQSAFGAQQDNIEAPEPMEEQGSPMIAASPTLSRFIAEEFINAEDEDDFMFSSAEPQMVTEDNVQAVRDDMFDSLVNEENNTAAPQEVDQAVSHMPETEKEETGQEEATDICSPLPNYAKPTIAFDARRKSMPVMSVTTPKSAGRPWTADTVIRPSTSMAFADLWSAKAKLASQRVASAKKSPARSSTPVPTSVRRTPARAGTPVPMSTRGGAETPGWIESIQKRQTPSRMSARIAERTPVPALSIQKLRSASPRKSTQTPVPAPSIQSRQSISPRKSILRIQHATPDMALPVPRPRKYTPTRMAPPKSPMKTPIKTPLKAPGATPGTYPMTPHPAQPLRSVTALVEVFTLDGSSASSPFIALLHRLGARTTKTWSERVTHVVFKDGSPTTLQKVRLANKDASEDGQAKREVFCVNSRWVTDCDREGRRMDERAEEYAVDVSEIPRGGKRRRKSMEPETLKKLDGNVVAATPKRKESFGRKSLARVSLASTFWGSSPVKGDVDTPTMDRENGDEDFLDDGDETLMLMGTPAGLTPGGAEERDWLVQQTAPVNKMRTLKLKEADKAKNRRLTFWHGMEER